MAVASPVEIQAIDRNAIDGELLGEWRELATHAMDPNPFLEPAFLLPAIKHFPSRVVLFLARCTDTGRLLGVAPFEHVKVSRTMPLDYLRAFQCPHTFLSGLMVDRDNARAVVEALFRTIINGPKEWHAIEFQQMVADGPQADVLWEVASELNLEWFEVTRHKRALLRPAAINPETYLNDVLSYKRRKMVRRNHRKLGELGEVQFRVRKGEQIDEAVINHFLDLENQGWKGEQGSSFASQPNQEAFFREMVRGFLEEDQIAFTELQLNGRAIASTCNLMSGQAGFAFKLGWDHQYEKYTPGILHEVAIAQSNQEVFPDALFIDSCADKSSFLEKLWPDRRTMVSGLFTLTTLGKFGAQAFTGLRSLKRQLSRSLALLS